MGWWCGAAVVGVGLASRWGSGVGVAALGFSEVDVVSAISAMVPIGSDGSGFEELC